MKTNRRLSFALTLLAVLFILHSSAWAQGTAFTYQGQLTASGQTANGSFDMAFSLYNAAASGTQIGNTVTNLATGVTNGLFMVTLDFGLTPYNGQTLWLQIAVSPAGSNTFAPLTPLQQLTSVPYAVQSLNATTVSGPVTLAQLPGTVLTNGAGNVTIAGTFTGNGGGLTNLNASQLSGTVSQAQLPGNVVTLTGGFNPQTNVYSSSGVYTLTVPAGATQMIAKLWGAGGGGGLGVSGGAGAFAQTTLTVVPGKIFTVVVGQHGDDGDSNAGGAGSGDAQGGPAGSGYSGQGGQASSLFYDTNGSYIMEAGAGGGGGASSDEQGGAGGNPGANGGFEISGDDGTGAANGAGGNGGITDGYGYPGGNGTNYTANAVSTGIPSLGSAGGNGGGGGGNDGYGGGGGGGYGGGGGGGGHGGGGGGGSYGQIIIAGTNNFAGNSGDPNYGFSAGEGGGGYGNGDDGLVVIIFPGPGIYLNVPSVVAGGFTGNGAGLTNLLAANLVGTISDSQLQSDVALLDQSPVFTTRVTMTNGLRLNNSPIYLRAGTDTNHGLAYAGTTVSNFGTNLPDGPVLWGFTGGVLGALSTGSPTAILSWNASGVAVKGLLSGNGQGLTNLQGSNLVGSIQGSNLVGSIQASNLAGTISDARLSTNVALLNANQMFRGSNAFTNTGNTFAGNGGGLTNLNAAQLSGTLNQAQVPTNVLTSTLGYFQTNVFSSAGVSTVTVPPGTTQMVVKLWGAGGGGGINPGFSTSPGGGGAFVEITDAVVPGQIFTIVVGQHGNSENSGAGGAGSGDVQGGNAGAGLSGQGGQASSLFFDTNGSYIMQAVAGGGGGGGSLAPGGPGGNPGTNGVSFGNNTGGSGGGSGIGGTGGMNAGNGNSNPGTNYAANATTTGIANLDLANGNGGNANYADYGGGGGGGYGGGGGATYYSGGGGGGSYGPTIIGGNSNLAGNSSDPNYIASAGNAGLGTNSGNDGLVIVLFGAQIVNVPGQIASPYFVGNGSGLTALSASALPATVAFLNSNQTFSGANAFTNKGNTFAGSFVGPLNATNCVVTNSAGSLTSGSSIDPSIFLRLFNGATTGSIGSPNVTGISFGQSSTRQAIVGGTYGNDYLDFYTGGVLTAPKVRIDDPGNVGIGTSTNALSYPLQMGNGAYCSAAGVWTSVSDRNAKENFQTVDPQAVLAKVAALPITEWNYKVESNTVKHVGPMAQDFHSAFGLGDNDKAIGSVDEDGVALTAIQGLNQKLNEVNAQNADLKAQLEALRAEIKELEKKQNSAP